MNQNFHLSLDIKGSLTHWKLSQFKRMFKDDEGKFITPEKARMNLLDFLSEGKLFLPYGECNNFDFKKGCLGHEVKNKKDGE